MLFRNVFAPNGEIDHYNWHSHCRGVRRESGPMRTGCLAFEISSSVRGWHMYIHTYKQGWLLCNSILRAEACPRCITSPAYPFPMRQALDARLGPAHSSPRQHHKKPQVKAAFPHPLRRNQIWLRRKLVTTNLGSYTEFSVRSVTKLRCFGSPRCSLAP